MKKLYVLFALCLTGSLFSPSVHADVCSCEMQEEKALFEKASAVFSANSITPTETANNALWNTFVVTNIEKTDKDSELLISSYEINGDKRAKIAQKTSDCNFSFEEGKHYRVFATLKQTQKGIPYFSTSQCSGTKEIPAPDLTPSSGEQDTVKQEKNITPEGQDAPTE
ncbi:MAG: hypothetical protein IPH06_01260 [Alphaproteobacteria bacterium]|jgi:hypothetical protein|nr:hypothetical protein [Alphaproteobacteria bacterium]QQS56690.1 MAG: hypothetical protein IPN28_10515 [Alphaproteobacteria bacterium]